MIRLWLLLLLLSAAFQIYAETFDEIVKKADEYFEKDNIDKAVTLYQLALKSGNATGAKPVYAKLASCFARLQAKIPEYAFMNWSLYFAGAEHQEIAEGLLNIYRDWAEKEPKAVLDIIERHLPDARSSDIPYETFLFRVATLHQRLGNKAESEKYLQEIVRYYDGEVYSDQAWKALFSLSLERRDLETAVRCLDKLPFSAADQMKLAELLTEERKEQQALEIYRRLILELDDRNGLRRTAMTSALNLELRQRRYDQALEYIRELKEKAETEKEKSNMALEEARIWLFNKQSFLMTTEGHYINSYENVNKAEKMYLSLLGDCEDFPEIEAAARLDLAGLYLSLFHYQKAEEQLTRLVKKFDDTAEGRRARELMKELK
ncbi:MAG: hypothetical protein PHQ23_02200 [Candidatus Wallbacteria bacterium]|nr:hypothetical protein [Candidatus Wallbacteria bacterium]